MKGEIWMKKYLFKGLLLITLILLVFAVAGCGGSQPVADEQTPAEEQQEATAEKTTTITASQTMDGKYLYWGAFIGLS